jgi:hypothetical protein
MYDAFSNIYFPLRVFRRIGNEFKKLLYVGARIAQSVQRLAMGWTTEVSEFEP